MVTYQVIFTNTTGTNVSTAFDTRFRDILPSGLTLNLGSVNVTLNGGATGLTNASAGNTVDLTIATIPVGGSVVVQYDATLAGSVTPGQTISQHRRCDLEQPGGHRPERAPRRQRQRRAAAG